MKSFKNFKQLFTIGLILAYLTACNTDQTPKIINKPGEEKSKAHSNPPLVENNREESIPTTPISTDKKAELSKDSNQSKDDSNDASAISAKEEVNSPDRNKTILPVSPEEKISDSPQVESGLMGNIGGGGALGSHKKRAIMHGGGGKAIKEYRDVPKEEYDANSQYKDNLENSFLNPSDNPLSTFSIDVDTASYTNSRRWLNNGNLPSKGVVRTEEFINYFTFDYKAPESDNEQPFSVYTEAASCPWNTKHQILQIGLKGKELKSENRKPSNLVFLIDVSGSMNSPDKLPLLISGLKMLVNHLGKDDIVAIVVYAGASGTALNPTSVKNKSVILNALDSLSPGGSTNGAAGIHLAYQLAEENFIKDGNNRIILATDGDFNVGTTSTDQLQTLIEEKRKTGVFLSVLGFGTGNLKDNLMETLANKGNGNYNYIDRLSEAQKVLVQQLNGTLFTIAKDVKIQIEFNPEHIAHYRLIGYENRILAAKDFNDDKKDAGEIGAGHTVTALYELVPVGVDLNIDGKVDDLKYQTPEKKKEIVKTNSNDILTLKIRYKKPNEDVSTKQTYVMLKNELGKSFENAKNNLLWATATAAFAQKLNKSNFLNDMSWEEIEKIAVKAKGNDAEGYRGEMIQLIKLAAAIGKN
jgi:Ca-activated chloride channel family protein